MNGRRPFTRKEFQCLASWFAEHGRIRELAWFTFGCLSGGLRVSEILSLRIGDLIQAGRMVDRVTVERRFMKGKRASRTVLLHPRARAVLTAWLKEMRAKGYIGNRDFVFQADRTNETRAISRVTAWRLLKKACLQCGIVGRTGTHSLRKTYAKNLYEATGHDLLKVQAAMNHLNIGSTQKYLDFNQEELDRAVLSVDW